MFDSNNKNWKRFIIPCGIALLFLMLFLDFSIFSDNLNNRTLAQEQKFIEEALEKNITTCYCVEGFYPPNLNYIEREYGFTYNSTKFYIDYTFIADNLRPHVIVLQK
ncbi:hypothetical protein [Lachnobacterium bovis]|uniref:hypothetical protein n=1 Tax=Lachnobacterium bovis TaxID=140626 RepID=UPI0006850552|nr:hypothetical protein [Lachnobacterium bovis]